MNQLWKFLPWRKFHIPIVLSVISIKYSINKSFQSYKICPDNRKEGTFPDSFYETSISLIPKLEKENKKGKENYRPVSLNTNVKILNEIWQNESINEEWSLEKILGLTNREKQNEFIIIFLSTRLTFMKDWQYQVLVKMQTSRQSLCRIG